MLPPDVPEVLARLCAAALAGALIGVDREVRGKPAGMRTHALVSLGAALVMVVVVRVTPTSFEHVDAISRAIQGVIAGVGFLGGGVILKTSGSEQDSVHGLTTAASVWLVAALGIAAGVGQWIAALIAVGLTLLILIGGYSAEKLARRIFGKHAP